MMSKDHENECCADLLFKLTPLRSNVHYKQVISYSYGQQASTSRSGRRNKGKSEQYQSSLPVYNKDKNPSTNSFILAQDRKIYSKQVAQTYNFLPEKPTQKSEILIAKPKSKYSYCNVCRDDYYDYLQHIRSDRHKISVRKTPASFFIRELQGKYANPMWRGLYRTREISSNKMTDTLKNTLEEPDQSVEILSAPSKRHKKEKKHEQKKNANLPTATMVEEEEPMPVQNPMLIQKNYNLGFFYNPYPQWMVNPLQNPNHFQNQQHLSIPIYNYPAYPAAPLLYYNSSFGLGCQLFPSIVSTQPTFINLVDQDLDAVDLKVDVQGQALGKVKGSCHGHQADSRMQATVLL